MQLHRLTIPASPDDPAWNPVRAYIAVEDAVKLDLFGHLDFSTDVAAMPVFLRDTAYYAKAAWVALPDDVAPASCEPANGLGALWLTIPLVEDVTTVIIDLMVHPEARGRGVGTALMSLAMAEADLRGRTLLATFTSAPPAAHDAPSWLPAASGTGGVDGGTVVAGWLTRLGFTLGQTEQMSMLALDRSQHAAFSTLAAGALRTAGLDYEPLTFVGPTPDDLVPGMALLHQAMSTDAPAGGLILDGQVWDADRIAHADARLAEAGKQRLRTVVRHRKTGELVAHSDLIWELARPAAIHQDDTVVRADHRGHRLGMLVKASNLVALPDANPAAERIHTWNAQENEHMLAINTQLGFQPTLVEGAWQRQTAAD